jgi:hypothetical protein
MRRWGTLIALGALLWAVPASAQTPASPMPGSFEQLGHNPLMNRGMNAALAVLDGYAYVGSRTDGTHANAGVFVVDVRNPAAPTIVKEIGPADGEGLPTQTSRELRILPEQKLLIVLNHQCNELIHRCAAPSNTGLGVLPSNFNIFDIAGANAANPKLVATIEPSAQGPQTPHEFFVWTDPKRPSRVLLYYTDPAANPEVVVTDLSKVREGQAPEIAGFQADAGGGVHSMTVSDDGRRMFLAALTGGFLEADTSEIAEGKEKPEIRQITPQENAPTWAGPGAHSAVRLPGRTPSRVMITDEVYGKIPGLFNDHGCPWGWVRFIDDTKPTKPVVVSEYRLPFNQDAYCAEVPQDRNTLSSWAAHNPTLTEHLAILTWHSAGLHAIDTSDPSRPTGAAAFSPEPLPVVQTEDPLLSSGQDKVVMWSFPVIVNGLIYVVDLRNGLYVLRYKGPHADEVSRVRFLDGNSNSGDQPRLENPPSAKPEGSGAGAGSGAGSGAGTTPPPSRRACLATPITLGKDRLGPFELGMSAREVFLLGGPTVRRTASRFTYCVEGKRKLVVSLRNGRVNGLLTNARPPAGRKAKGSGVTLRRGRVSLIKRRRVAVIGVVAKSVKRRDAQRLARSL